MKTNNNQTGLSMPELTILKAANEDGISSDVIRQQAWSPREVWRTRVKSSSKAARKKSPPIQ
jgi:hypothetical protein